MATLCDLRGLDHLRTARYFDWAEDPPAGNPASVRPLKHVNRLAVRYSEARMVTSCEEKVLQLRFLGAAKKAADDMDMDLTFDMIASYARGSLSIQPDPTHLGDSKPFLGVEDSPRLRGPQSILDREPSSPNQSPSRVLSRPPSPVPRPGSGKVPPASPVSGSASDSSSDSESPSSSSSDEAVDFVSNWQTDLEWFTSQSYVHWVGLPKPGDPEGALRANKGCSMLVHASSVGSEDSSLLTSLRAGVPWCGRCRDALLKKHPDAKEAMFG
jgi:hypothetical protein